MGEFVRSQNVKRYSRSSTNPDAKLGAAMTSLRFLLSISRRCFD